MTRGETLAPPRTWATSGRTAARSACWAARLGPALAGEAVDGAVALVEDHDPVVVEGLGHEDADLEVEPVGVERGAAALDHRFVPPGDAAQLAQRAGSRALIELSISSVWDVTIFSSIVRAE